MMTMIKRLPIAVLGLLALMTSACSDQKDPVTSIPPVFSVTPVNMSGAFNPADSSLGDIRFSRPVLIPFGAMIDLENQSYGFQYITRPGALVRAVTAGVIDTIITHPPPEEDYTIVVICTPGSDYILYQDHVVNLRVLEHTPVKPGDTLGEAGNWSDSLRRTGLRISLGEGADMRFHCPLNYANPSFRDLHVNLLAEYRRLGFTPVYDTLCITGPLRP